MKLCKDCKYFTAWLSDNPAHDSFTCGLTMPVIKPAPIDPVNGRPLFEQPTSCKQLRKKWDEYDELMLVRSEHFDLCGIDGKHFEPKEQP